MYEQPHTETLDQLQKQHVIKNGQSDFLRQIFHCSCCPKIGKIMKNTLQRIVIAEMRDNSQKSDDQNI